MTEYRRIFDKYQQSVVKCSLRNQTRPDWAKRPPSAVTGSANTELTAEKSRCKLGVRPIEYCHKTNSCTRNQSTKMVVQSSTRSEQNMFASSSSFLVSHRKTKIRKSLVKLVRKLPTLQLTILSKCWPLAYRSEHELPSFDVKFHQERDWNAVFRLWPSEEPNFLRPNVQSKSKRLR